MGVKFSTTPRKLFLVSDELHHCVQILQLYGAIVSWLNGISWLQLACCTVEAIPN